MDFSKLHDDEIVSTLKTLRGTECKVIADIVLYLSELDKRGSYRELGYSSLFTYMTKSLGYSECSASKRVRAVRCHQENPEIYQLLRDGRVSLSALSQVSSVITPENKNEVLALTEGSSKREAQRIAVSFGAPEPAKRETIRAKKVVVRDEVTERYSFSFEVSTEVQKLFEEVKSYMGGASAAEVFEKLLTGYLKKRTGAGIRKRMVKPVTKRNRAIPVTVRREVFKRDNCQCTFLGAEGRCTETKGLEIDHIVPYAVGGTNEPENLRLLCRAHNTLSAERSYGRDFMQSFCRRSTVPRTDGIDLIYVLLECG